MVLFRAVALAVVCLCSIAVRAAESDRDYVYPEEIATTAKKAAARNHIIAATGQSVAYTSFWDSKVYTLTEYTGVYTSWLLDATWTGGLTTEQIRDMVDRSDMLFAQYKQLLGAEPSGSGLLRIAIVPSTCGTGCGVVGARGIEYRSDSLDHMKEALAANTLPDVIVHEMAHNYDIFRPQIAYTEDPGHAWTAFMEPYMMYYSGMGAPDASASEALRQGLDSTFLAWIRKTGVTWEACVRDNACTATGIGAREAWAGIWLWYAKVHGAEALMRAFNYLRQQTGSVDGAENKENMRLQALQAGLPGADLNCVFAEWKWKMLTPSGLCRTVSAGLDADNDGFSARAGDLADATAGVGSPLDSDAGATDTNGDLIAGNALVYEPPGGDFASPQDTAYPVSLHGVSTAGDVETFRFAVPATGTLRFAVRFQPATTVQTNLFTLMFARPTGGSTTYTFAYPANHAGIAFSADISAPAGPWTVTFTPPEGGYTFSVFPAPADGRGTWANTAAPAMNGSAYRLTSLTASLGGATPDRVRYWVSGVGIVGEAPYSATTMFDWTPPAGLAAGTYGYRVQGVDNAGVAETNYTAARWFTVGGGVTPPCSYSLNPVSQAAPATSGTGSIAVTATAGCAWTAVSDNPDWLTVSGGATGTGNGTVTFAVAANASASTRTGSITVAGQTFTITQAAGSAPPPPPPPDVVSLSPLSGSGTSVMATAVFRHPGGQSEHYLGYILFLPLPNVVSFNAQGTCLIEFNRLGGRGDGRGGVRLINNEGLNWLGPIEGVPAAPGTPPLTNNACTVNAAGVTVSFSGTDMTVRVPVTFHTAANVSATMATFIQSNSTTGQWTDFRQFGNWTVPGAPVRNGPRIVSGTPTAGTGASGTFAITAGHSAGLNQLGEVHIRFASSIVGSTSCHIIYSPAVNVMAMINDAGTALVGPVALGQPLTTNRCSVPAGAWRTVAGTNVTLNLPVNFNASAFGAGTKNVYVNGFDITGAVTHWVQTGTWTVQ